MTQVFWRADSLLTGASKAALSQITGEINVFKGLDAVDTLNPGRESFYEESEHFKALRRYVIGEGERVGGLLARVISAVLLRSQVRSAVTEVLGRASQRRRALEDVSSAVTNLISRDDQTSSLLLHMLKSNQSHANGLASAKPYELGAPPSIATLTVKEVQGAEQPSRIDYGQKVIEIDTSRPDWNWSLVLFDNTFELIHKKGQANQPIAEIDWKDRKIFVNWGHSVKLQMEERGFLRTALAWVLAKEAASKDSEAMMDLALHLLSFTTGTNG